MPRALEYGRYYRKWHPEDDRHVRKMLRYHVRTLGRFLPPDRDSRILDIGSGMGFLLTLLKESGYTLAAGLEIDPGQAEACRAKHLDVSLVRDAAEYLRPRPESWEVILALDVLEHVPIDRTEDLLSAIFGGLAPGGRFIATVPNASSGLAFRWRYNDWTHETSFTEASFAGLLRKSGFESVRILESGSFLRPRLPLLVRPAVFRWLLLRAGRAFRRLEMMTELGCGEGRSAPLSLNLLAVADKPRA